MPAGDKPRLGCDAAVAALLAFAVALAGCSAGPGGNRLTLFPAATRLLDSARAVRAGSAGAPPLPRELDKRVAPPYTVEPGDVLLVQPADIDSPVRFPGDQPVLPDGTINLGRYGQLEVAGKTIPEIELQARAQIDAILRAQPAPRPSADAGDRREVGPISVRVATRQSKVYYVLGEVNAPGSFTLRGNETVLDGIISAGGLNDRASRRNIILSRPTPPAGCRVVLPVCYSEIVQLGDTSTNYQLAAGDRIYVPTRGCKEKPSRGWWSKSKECPWCGGPQVPCPEPAPPDHGCAYKWEVPVPAGPPDAPRRD